jgi:hypothetical protein
MRTVAGCNDAVLLELDGGVIERAVHADALHGINTDTTTTTTTSLSPCSTPAGSTGVLVRPTAGIMMAAIFAPPPVVVLVVCCKATPPRERSSDAAAVLVAAVVVAHVDWHSSSKAAPWRRRSAPARHRSMWNMAVDQVWLVREGRRHVPPPKPSEGQVFGEGQVGASLPRKVIGLALESSVPYGSFVFFQRASQSRPRLFAFLDAKWEVEMAPYGAKARTWDVKNVVDFISTTGLKQYG